VKPEAIDVSEQPERGKPPRNRRVEPPPFDPDPELVGHREGIKWEIKRAQRALLKMKAAASEERDKPR
jgi:hypothetical protein